MFLLSFGILPALICDMSVTFQILCGIQLKRSYNKTSFVKLPR